MRSTSAGDLEHGDDLAQIVRQGARSAIVCTTSLPICASSSSMRLSPSTTLRARSSSRVVSAFMALSMASSVRPPISAMSARSALMSSSKALTVCSVMFRVPSCRLSRSGQ